MGSTIFKGNKVATLKDTLQVGKDDSTAPTIRNIAVNPTSVATEGNPGSIAINNVTGEIYKKNDSGVTTSWEDITSGSSAGGINYINNPDFEASDDGWNKYHDGLVSTPVDGTGGVPLGSNLTRSTNAVDRLRGEAHYFLIKAVTFVAQGDGFSTDFEIDKADQSSRLYVSFDYRTEFDFVSGDIRVFVYDIDNATLVGAVENGDDGNIVATGGVNRKFTGSFETSSNSLNYRLIFHYAGTGTDKTEFYIDNVRVGPDTLVPGAIIGEPVSFTPSFAGGVTVGNGTFSGASYTRFGKWMKGNFTFNLGSTSSITGTPNFLVPDGLVGDTSVIDSSSVTTVGQGQLSDSGTNFHPALIKMSAAGTNLDVTAHSASDPSVGGLFINGTTPFTWTTGDAIYVEWFIPIESWSPGALLSTTENLFSTARGRFKLSGDQNITSTAETKVEFDTVEFDNLDAFSTSNNEYTIPRDGFYYVKGSAVIINFTGEDQMALGVAINGTVEASIFEREAGVATNVGIHVSTFLQLSKGDLVTITADSSSDANYDVNSASTGTYFEIFEVPNFSTFSVFGETELVESSATPAAYTGTVDQFHDLTSIVLTPGEWDVDALVVYKSNGATTTTIIGCGINDVAGNNGGSEAIDHALDNKTGTSNSRQSISFYKRGLILTSTTTIYLKGYGGASTTNLDAGYKISARRIK